MAGTSPSPWGYVEVPDVRAIRRGLHISQHGFARTYRISLGTLKNRGQGRRQTDAPAAAYLPIIVKRPREARGCWHDDQFII